MYTINIPTNQPERKGVDLTDSRLDYGVVYRSLLNGNDYVVSLPDDLGMISVFDGKLHAYDSEESLLMWLRDNDLPTVFEKTTLDCVVNIG